MEKIIFSQLEADKSVAGYTLVTKIEQLETKGGSAYCKVTLSDGEKTIDANLWSTEKAQITSIKEEDVICADIACKKYQERLTYELRRYSPVDATCPFNVGDFVMKAPVGCEEMYSEILRLVELTKKSSEDYDSLTDLVAYLYETNKDKLLYWSAAKGIHHNFYGGLLYHTLRMVKTAHCLVRVYPLDSELLCCAVALHDIGKLKELETTTLGSADYTVDGALFGHLLIGIEMINDAASKGNYNPESIRLLKHCIAAHHGHKEWGAMQEPMTPEAYALFAIDMIDSRMEIYDKVLEGLEPGQLSDRQFALGNIPVYKGVG